MQNSQEKPWCYLWHFSIFPQLALFLTPPSIEPVLLVPLMMLSGFPFFLLTSLLSKELNNQMNGCMSWEWPRTEGHLSICFCRWLLVGFHHGGGWGLTFQLPFKSPQQLSSLCLNQARTCSEAQFASPGLRLGSGSLDLHPPLLEWICLRNDLYLWLWFCLEGQSCNRAPHTLNTLWSWPRQSASVGLSFGSGQVAQVLCPRVPYHCKAGMGLTCPGLCLRGYSTRRM